MLAGEENLIPMSERTKDEQREIARKGGIASGESRRRRKQLQEQADFLFSLPLPDIKKKDEKGEVKSLLEEFKQISGIKDENEIDNQMAILIALQKQALNGNVYAANAIFELLGEKKTNVNLNGGVTVKFSGENDIAD